MGYLDTIPALEQRTDDAAVQGAQPAAGIATGLGRSGPVADPPRTGEPSAYPGLVEALDRIADAIAHSPRSPILNDLALSRAARAVVEAGRVVRSLPDGARAEAARRCERTFAETAGLIERGRYADAYAALDGLPAKLLRKFQ